MTRWRGRSRILQQRLERMSRSRKPFLEAQIADLERFVRLCQQNGIELTVAINPLTRANASGYVPGRLEDTSRGSIRSRTCGISGTRLARG